MNIFKAFTYEDLVEFQNYISTKRRVNQIVEEELKKLSIAKVLKLQEMIDIATETYFINRDSYFIERDIKVIEVKNDKKNNRR